MLHCICEVRNGKSADGCLELRSKVAASLVSVDWVWWFWAAGGTNPITLPTILSPFFNTTSPSLFTFIDLFLFDPTAYGVLGPRTPETRPWVQGYFPSTQNAEEQLRLPNQIGTSLRRSRRPCSHSGYQLACIFFKAIPDMQVPQQYLFSR